MLGRRMPRLECSLRAPAFIRSWLPVLALGFAAGTSACGALSSSETALAPADGMEEEALRLHVHLSGHPGHRGENGSIVLDTLSFRLLVNGVQVLDSTFVPELDLTGHVHSRVIRVAPGTVDFRVIDRRTSTTEDYRLRIRREPMWVHVRFVNEGVVLSSGNGMLGFLE